MNEKEGKLKTNKGDLSKREKELSDSIMELKNVEELSQDQELQYTLEYHDFSAKMFEKYIQIALNEMAASMKIDPTKLGDEYFNDLPPSALTNLDDYNFFKGFLRSDLKIESLRNAKFTILRE